MNPHQADGIGFGLLERLSLFRLRFPHLVALIQQFDLLQLLKRLCQKSPRRR